LIARFYGQNNNHWIWPVKTNIRLTGNYGEIRPNHFHSGLDIATGSDHIPIIAIGDGYLYRIKSSTYGYGNAVHIAHKNGYTSLYAHLFEFSDRILAYLDTLRYHYELYEIDCYTGNDSILIKQGDTIGYAGNTGASLGPHLHFEIRKTLNEIPLNPLLFFNLYDPYAPVLNRLVAVPLDSSGKTSNIEQYVDLEDKIKPATKKKSRKTNKKRGKKKTGAKTKKKKGKGGFDDEYINKSTEYACLEHEMISERESDCAYLVQVPKNKKSKTKKQMKKASSTKSSKSKVESKLVSKELSYEEENSEVKDSLVNLRLKDSVIENTSIKDKIKINKVPKRFGIQMSAYDTDLGGSVNNVFSAKLYFDSMLITSMQMDSMSFEDLRYINAYLDMSGKVGGKMQKLYKSKSYDIPIYKTIKNNGIIELNDTLLHLLRIELSDIKRNIKQKIYTIQWNGNNINEIKRSNLWDNKAMQVFEDDSLLLGADVGSFYYPMNPSIYKVRSEIVLMSPQYKVFSKGMFIHKWLGMSMKHKAIADSLVDKLCMVSIDGKQISYVPSDYYGGRVQAQIRKSGNYAIYLDTTAPKIRALFDIKKMKGSTLKFNVNDNLSGVKRFKLYLNGKYVQAKHESKSSLVYYELDEAEKLSLDQVDFILIDNKDNQSHLSLRKIE
jgi:hypothetical protein